MNFVLVAVVSGTKIVVSLSMNPVGKNPNTLFRIRTDSVLDNGQSGLYDNLLKRHKFVVCLTAQQCYPDDVRMGCFNSSDGECCMDLCRTYPQMRWDI